MAFHDDDDVHGNSAKNCLCTQASGAREETKVWNQECVPLPATHWSALPGPTTPKLWFGRSPPSKPRRVGTTQDQSVVEEFAQAHDAGLWRCLQNILQLDLHQCFVEVEDAATLRYVLVALGSAELHICEVGLTMVHDRHSHVAAELLEPL